MNRIVPCFVSLITAPALLADSWSPDNDRECFPARGAFDGFTCIDGTDHMIVGAARTLPWFPSPTRERAGNDHQCVDAITKTNASFAPKDSLVRGREAPPQTIIREARGWKMPGYQYV